MGIRTLFLLSFILFSVDGLAQPADVGGVTLNGDNVSRDYETRTVTIEGHVKIEIGDQTLTCDKASVNLQKNEVLAIGNVLLTSPTTSIQASKMQYNYKTKTGQIEDGFVQAGQVVFEGKKVERTGENTYIAKGAKYTSCTTCPAAWSFSGSEIDAEVGGYAYIKYPVLRIADFPVFILPRILIPLKTQRESGILVPSLEFSSKGGAAVSESIFWAIDPSQDATVTFTHYEKRGLKTHVEYRYMLNEESSGILQMAHLKDRAFTESGRSNTNDTTLYRSFVHYKHYYELPNNMVQRADLNLVSDLRYPRDFTDDLAGHGNPSLENKVSLTNNTETQHRSIEAAYYINLLEADSQSNNDRAVHRFPEINYNIAQQEVANTGLFWRLDFNYVNFSRRDFSYDDTTGPAGTGDPTRRVKADNDGEYDPNTDIIRTGHRMIVSPTINYPFRIGKLFDVVPSATYNEAQYRFNATPDVATCPANTDCGQNAVRRYLQTDVAVRTKTSLVFGKDDGVSNRYKHEIVPELIYSTIPWIERPDHVFFGDFEDQPYSRRQEQVTNDDFYGTSKLQFDYKDRLFDKRLATLVLTNNIIRKQNTGDVASYNKLVTFRLKQSYDFNERGADDPQPWSPINGLLDIRGDRFENHTVADFYVYGKVTNWSTRLRYMTTLRNFVELTYTRERFVDEKAVNSSSKEIENYGIGTGFKLKYFNFAGRANYSRVTHVFEGWEYIATFKPPGDCWTIDFKQAETVGYDLTTKLNVNFEFGGTI